jgi:hypothetical protein
LGPLSAAVPADESVGALAIVAGLIAAVRLARVESREIQNRSPRVRSIISESDTIAGMVVEDAADALGRDRDQLPQRRCACASLNGVALRNQSSESCNHESTSYFAVCRRREFATSPTSQALHDCFRIGPSSGSKGSPLEPNH